MRGKSPKVFGGSCLDGGVHYIILVSAQTTNNILSGGGGDDIFRIMVLPNSSNTITDLEINNVREKIDLRNCDINNFSDLQISQNGSDTILGLKDNQTIILKNVNSTQLSSQNFIFKINGTDGNDIIRGSNDNESIFAGSGNDKIFASIGDDGYLTGGEGNDIFVIEKNPQASTTINDFEINNINEKIQIRNFADVREFNDLSIEYHNNYLTNKYDAYINLGDGQKLIIKGITLNSLVANNFEFYFNSAPSVISDIFTTNEDTPITIKLSDLLANDTDIEDVEAIKDLSLDKFIFGTPNKGRITTDAAAKTITYTPNKDYNGSDNLTYKIKDSNGAFSNLANIRISVRSMNDAPVANSDSFATNEDTPITIRLRDLLVNDSDVEDKENIKNISFSNFVFGNPGKGTITQDLQNNAIIYTPNRNYNGKDSLSYKIKDSNGISSNFTKINFDIVKVNDAPTVGSKLSNQFIKAGNPFSYILSANSFSDADDRILNYSAKLADGSNLPSWLNFDAATKTFSGTPPSGAGSSTLIKVIASDGKLEAFQTFSINIANNAIKGTNSGEFLEGTNLNDEIRGYDGADIIWAKEGDDIIIAGRGVDTISGGAGKDQFVYNNILDSKDNAIDLILDFTAGEDKINVTGLGFDHITSGLGSSNSGRGLEYYFEGRNTIIDDPNSNFAIKIAGEIDFSNSDFVF